MISLTCQVFNLVSLQAVALEKVSDSNHAITQSHQTMRLPIYRRLKNIFLSSDIITQNKQNKLYDREIS